MCSITCTQIMLGFLGKFLLLRRLWGFKGGAQLPNPNLNHNIWSKAPNICVQIRIWKVCRPRSARLSPMVGGHFGGQMMSFGHHWDSKSAFNHGLMADWWARTGGFEKPEDALSGSPDSGRCICRIWTHQSDSHFMVVGANLGEVCPDWHNLDTTSTGFEPTGFWKILLLLRGLCEDDGWCPLWENIKNYPNLHQLWRDLVAVVNTSHTSHFQKIL